MRLLRLDSIRTSFYVDSCKRMCSCAMCPKPLLKDDKRFVVHHVYSSPIHHKKGVIGYRDYFFHIACFTKLLEAPEETASVAKCFDCREHIEHPSNFTAIRRKRNEILHAALCANCATHPRWRFCIACKLHMPRAATSPIISDGLPSSQILCDHCAKESNLLTVKQRKQLRRNSES